MLRIPVHRYGHRTLTLILTTEYTGRYNRLTWHDMTDGPSCPSVSVGLKFNGERQVANHAMMLNPTNPTLTIKVRKFKMTKLTFVR